MLEKMVGYIIPVVSVGLTYILGRLQSTQSAKREAYKEAYDAFYLPYITLLYESQIWCIGFARLNPEYRYKLFKLIGSNIKYMNKVILEYVDVLYGSYDAILGKELLDIDSMMTHDRTDEIFEDITVQVLSRATWLARKLHQPPIGEFVLELFLEEKEARGK